MCLSDRLNWWSVPGSTICDWTTAHAPFTYSWTSTLAVIASSTLDTTTANWSVS